MAPEPKPDERTVAHVSEPGQDPTAQSTRKVTTHYAPEDDREKALDKRINRKLDLFVTLPISFGWMFIAIDKSNIGYVATSSFIQEANVSPNAVGLSLSLFSSTYVPFHITNTVLAFVAGPRLFIALQLFCCGVISSAHAAIRSSVGLVVLRLLLGVFEAGYNPASLFLMSQVYPRRNLGLRMGFFTCMFAAAGASAGAITYGLLSVKSEVIGGWQLVFLVEGILPVVTGLAVYCLVPQSMETAPFLSAEERAHASLRMRLDKGELTPAGASQARETSRRSGLGHITWRDFTDVTRDWKKLLIVLFGICIITSMNAFPAFLPVLAEGMGFRGTLANVMSVSPFVAAIAAQVVGARASDRYLERGHAIAASSLAAAVFAVVMGASGNNAARYAAMHFCVSAVMISGSLISVWLANNTPGSGAKSFVLGLNGATHIGGVIAGQLFNVKYEPTYSIPLYVVAGLLILGGVGMELVRYLYVRENKRRRQITAGWGERDFEAEKVSTARRGDQRLDFQYTL